MNAVLPRLHAKLAEETDGHLLRVAKEYSALYEKAYDLRLRSLLHHTLAEHPTAVSITLEESDQGTGAMFPQWVTLASGEDVEDYGDHEEAIEMAALGIEAVDLENEVAWTEQGDRYSGSKGYLTFATILENYGGRGA